jgi:thiamine biosynthesis lipoprotein
MRIAILTILSVLTMSANTVHGAEPRRFEFSEPHMGTQFKIILYADDEQQARAASKAAFSRIAELNLIMSDYDPASELMRLCARSGGEPVPVSKELFFVLTKAEEASRLSDGAFDVTVGPATRLWRQSRRTQRLPDPEKLAAARAVIGWQNVKLDAKERTVQLLKKGMQLDLGGIAKGYAADEAQVVLKKHGITRALVAAGGDIVVSDPPPDRKGWDIVIQPLDEEETKQPRHLSLANAAVSTSGDANQFVVIDGKRYSHILDPRTGLGLIGRMSVTVVAPNGVTSDSLTKVVCVLGPEKGLPLVEKVDGVSARMVRLDEQDRAEKFTSKRFPALTIEGKKE